MLQLPTPNIILPPPPGLIIPKHAGKLINPYSFSNNFGGPSGPPAAADILFITSNASSSNLGSYTFSAQSFGNEAADRHIILGCGTEAGTTKEAVVTLGGISATQIAWSHFNGGQTGLYIAAVPTGATGDVVVDNAGTASGMNISIFRAVGLGSITPTDFGVAIGTSLTDTITIPDNGIAVVYTTSVVTNDSCGFTNITGRTSMSYDVGQTQSAGACDNYASGGSIALTATWVTGDATNGAVFVSWGP